MMNKSASTRRSCRRVLVSVAMVIFTSLANLAFLRPVNAEQLPQLLFILDSSSSMEDQLDGELKYKLVRRAMSSVLSSRGGTFKAGLTTFGRNHKNSCKDVARILPLKTLRPRTFLQTLDDISPNGKSPVSVTLLDAASIAETAAGPVHILVIADGGDNCRKDMCATAQLIAKHAPQTRIHVIGVGNTTSVARLACLPQATKGLFAPIADAAEMAAALDQILQTLTPEKPNIVKKPVRLKQAFAQLLKPPLPARRPPHKLAKYGKSATATTKPADRLSTAIERVVQEALPKQITTPAAEVRPRAPQKPVTLATSDSGPDTVAAMPEVAQATPPAAKQQKKQIPASTFFGNKPGIEITLPQTSASVKLGALIAEEGQQIENGLVWRIYNTKKDDDGRYKLVKSMQTPRFEAKLPLGVYLVNLSWGRSHLTEKIDILSSKPFTRNFILNAGGLRLGARHTDGSVLTNRQVVYQIFSDERDQFGKRQLILDNARPEKTIRLNAGIYHVSSLFGTANGVIDADITVEAGKLTDVVINHSASKVTFKLVNQPGGEALAGATWRISTPDGKLIKETGGALPTLVLAAGDYTILARYSGRSFARKVTIEPGDPVHVEIVIQ